MHFLNPLVLWLLAVVPPLGAAMVWLAWRRKKQLQAYFGEERLVSRYSKPLARQAYQFKAMWAFLGLAALIVALARPSLERGHTEFPQGTVDVIAIVDVSRSMAAQDYKGQLSGHYFSGGTRLDMARYLIVQDVVPSLQGNRLGVVSFAGDGFPQAFLTDDMPALGWVLRRALTVSSAPGEGSELVKAFNLAFQLYDLDSDPNHRKVVVLFSDGGNDDGLDALADVVSECKKRDIEVIVAGLGKTTPSAIPVSELAPPDQYAMRGKDWYEVDGEVAMTALDENTLRYFANATGGRYVRVTAPEDFHIGSLISSVEMKHKPGEQEIFYFPLILAAVLLFLSWVSPMEPRAAKESTPVSKPERQRAPR